MRKKNVIELAISGTMPFISVVLLFLARFVSLGFKLPDSSFWVDAAVNTVSLLCFFIPFKSIFKQKYLESERIIGKRDEYSALVAKVYDNRLKTFDEWTKKEFEHRKSEYIDLQLQQLLIENARERFNSYGMSSVKVMKDKSLSYNQKRTLVRLIHDLPRIKKIEVSQCLPGTDGKTVFKRINTIEEQVERRLTAARVMRSIVVCGGMAMLTITTKFDASILAVLTEIALKILIGLWYIFGAARIADTLINKVYFKELSEKSLIIQEFLEAEK